MANIELSDVMNSISRIQLNYTNLAKSWFDIFYNPHPMDVQLEFYDTDGKLATYIIPNRAKDKNFFTNGAGEPSDNSENGTVYVNTEDGTIWVKFIEGWSQVITEAQLKSFLMEGEGNPDDSISAPNGTLYVNRKDSSLWMKRANGWAQIDSYPTTIIKESFDVPDGTTEIKLQKGTCRHIDLMQIFENGVLVPPANYKIKADNKTVTFYDAPFQTPKILNSNDQYVETESTVHIEIQYYMDIHFEAGLINDEFQQFQQQYAEAVQTVNYGINYIDSLLANLMENFSTEALEREAASLMEQLNTEFLSDREELETIWKKTEKFVNDNLNTFSTNVSLVTSLYNETVNLASEAKLSATSAARDAANARVYMETVQNDANSLTKNTDFVKLERALFGQTAILADVINNADPRGYLESMQADFLSSLNTVNQRLSADILEKEDALKSLITATESELTTKFGWLSDIVDENTQYFKNWTNSHVDLANFSNEVLRYYNYNNFPIDNNAIYHYFYDMSNDNDLTFPTQAELQSGQPQEIVVNVTKDCSYYTYDLGKFMEGPKDSDTVDEYYNKDWNFTFDIIPDQAINLSRYEVEGDIYEGLTSGIVSVIRVAFINDTPYTPKVTWSNRIKWINKIGGFETAPEFEKYKDYIMEFISFDNMTTWYAYALGLPQVPVEIDTFPIMFNMVCDITDTNLFEGGINQISANVGQYAIGKAATLTFNIDEEEIELDEPQYFKVVPGVCGGLPHVNISMEIDRKYRGLPLENVRFRIPQTEKNYTYFVNSDLDKQGHEVWITPEGGGDPVPGEDPDVVKGMKYVLNDNIEYKPDGSNAPIVYVNDRKKVERHYHVYVNVPAIDTVVSHAVGNYKLQAYSTGTNESIDAAIKRVCKAVSESSSASQANADSFEIQSANGEVEYTTLTDWVNKLNVAKTPDTLKLRSDIDAYDSYADLEVALSEINDVDQDLPYVVPYRRKGVNIETAKLIVGWDDYTTEEEVEDSADGDTYTVYHHDPIYKDIRVSDFYPIKYRTEEGEVVTYNQPIRYKALHFEIEWSAYQTAASLGAKGNTQVRYPLKLKAYPVFYYLNLDESNNGGNLMEVPPVSEIIAQQPVFVFDFKTETAVIDNLNASLTFVETVYIKEADQEISNSSVELYTGKTYKYTHDYTMSNKIFNELIVDINTLDSEHADHIPDPNTQATYIEQLSVVSIEDTNPSGLFFKLNEANVEGETDEGEQLYVDWNKYDLDESTYTIKVAPQTASSDDPVLIGAGEYTEVIVG